MDKKVKFLKKINFQLFILLLFSLILLPQNKKHCWLDWVTSLPWKVISKLKAVSSLLLMSIKTANVNHEVLAFQLGFRIWDNFPLKWITKQAFYFGF